MAPNEGQPISDPGELNRGLRPTGVEEPDIQDTYAAEEGLTARSAGSSRLDRAERAERIAQGGRGSQG